MRLITKITCKERFIQIVIVFYKQNLRKYELLTLFIIFRKQAKNSKNHYVASFFFYDILLLATSILKKLKK